MFVKVQLELIFADLNEISGGLNRYNILAIVEKNPFGFNKIFVAQTYSNGIIRSLHKH